MIVDDLTVYRRCTKLLFRTNYESWLYYVMSFALLSVLKSEDQQRDVTNDKNVPKSLLFCSVSSIVATSERLIGYMD